MITARINNNGTLMSGTFIFETAQELQRSESDLLDNSNGEMWYDYEESLVGQCECCDDYYLKTDEVRGGKVSIKHPEGMSGFCCEECKGEAEEEMWVHAQEDAREAEMWGNDYDSWYR